MINKNKQINSETTCYDCQSYQSIPNDNGQTNYCIFKGRFIKQSRIEKKCGVFEPKIYIKMKGGLKK